MQETAQTMKVLFRHNTLTSNREEEEIMTVGEQNDLSNLYIFKTLIVDRHQ
jgi:hypothetical protein